MPGTLVSIFSVFFQNGLIEAPFRGSVLGVFFSISFGSTVASIWMFNAPLFFVRIFFERFFENL